MSAGMNQQKGATSGIATGSRMPEQVVVLTPPSIDLEKRHMAESLPTYTEPLQVTVLCSQCGQ